LRAALVVVDVQRDFCPGGALPVRESDEVVPRINKVVMAFEHGRIPIFFTRDWHPSNHVSFKGQGGIWPPHCVQESAGAEFHPALRIPIRSIVISKGIDSRVEAYSGFQGTDLEVRLKKMGVVDVFLCGLATDYCVKMTAIDARHAGFAVEVIRDCIGAVDARPGDGAKAISEMREAGATITQASAVIKKMAGTQQ